jgi:cephalosporin hydroxylase
VTLAPVETFQNEWELNQLIDVVRQLRPKRILEVGAMYGGTLWHWLQIADTVVVVDDEMRGAETWFEWESEFDSTLVLLEGESNHPELIKAAGWTAPYDFAFIDGGHLYEAVLADWRNYGPLAEVVAFHDILPRSAYGVWELWAQLKAEPGARYIEIAHNATLPGNEGPCGVGVLWT